MLLNTAQAQVLIEIRDRNPRVGKLQSHPGQRNPNKYHLYHCDHGHDTKDSLQLQDEIEELIQCGCLDWFIKHRQEQPKEQQRLPRPPEQWQEEPSGDQLSIELINTITRGHQSRVKELVEPAKKWKIEEYIAFIEEDALGVQFLHNVWWLYL